MLYPAVPLERQLLDQAHHELRTADDGAGDPAQRGDGVLSPAERQRLGRDLQRAASALGAGNVDLTAILRGYGRQVHTAFARVNQELPQWLSPQETARLGSPLLRARVQRAQEHMRAGAASAWPRGEDGLHRRQLSDRYRYPGSGPVKVAFFDADSTLRVSKSGSVSANGPRDVELLPFVGNRLAELAAQGYLIAIVSNQGGVGDGHVNIHDADEALRYTAQLVREAGGDVHYIDFAESRGEDRKPSPGMAQRLERTLKERFGDQASIDRAQSFMVGDSAYKASEIRPDSRPGFNFSNSDRGFAKSAGIAFHEPQTFFGWDRFGAELFDELLDVQRFWTDVLGAP